MVVLRRGYSVPEHVTMFAVGAAGLGAAYPALMAHTGGHGLPCPLRTLTGVPCPFCGMTTATVSLTHGEWGSAAAANFFGRCRNTDESQSTRAAQEHSSEPLASGREAILRAVQKSR